MEKNNSDLDIDFEQAENLYKNQQKNQKKNIIQTIISMIIFHITIVFTVIHQKLKNFNEAEIHRL